MNLPLFYSISSLWKAEWKTSILQRVQILTGSLESTHTTCLYVTFISLHLSAGHGANKNLTVMSNVK